MNGVVASGTFRPTGGAERGLHPVALAEPADPAFLSKRAAPLRTDAEGFQRRLGVGAMDPREPVSGPCHRPRPGR